MNSSSKPSFSSSSALSVSSAKYSCIGRPAGCSGIMNIPRRKRMLRSLIGDARSRNLLHRLEIQSEHLGGGAAEDVAPPFLGQERKIVDHARQIEVPVRIVRRPHE